jgi:hypothetical protein
LRGDILSYKEYVQDLVEKGIQASGGLRKFANEIGQDPAVICKVRKGNYIPTRKTLKKWFSLNDELLLELENDEDPILFLCPDLKSLRDHLSVIGYELVIQKKG